MLVTLAVNYFLGLSAILTYKLLAGLCSIVIALKITKIMRFITFAVIATLLISTIMA